jgi:cytochrome c-type biogenesis protein CcmH/NrfF
MYLGYLNWNGYSYLWLIALLILILSILLALNIQRQGKKDILADISTSMCFLGILAGVAMLFDNATSILGQTNTQTFLFWIPLALMLLIATTVTYYLTRKKSK